MCIETQSKTTQIWRKTHPSEQRWQRISHNQFTEKNLVWERPCGRCRKHLHFTFDQDGCFACGMYVRKLEHLLRSKLNILTGVTFSKKTDYLILDSFSRVCL